MVRRRDQFIGCLLGGAIGDALGFTTENLTYDRIRQRLGRVEDYVVKPGWGYYTDDTQMTILLAETILEAGGFDERVFRRKLGRWWVVWPRLSGRSTKNAALKSLLGMKETGRHVPGSSGAMRAAPLGLWYYDDLEALFRETVACCRVTHTHPSAIAGALVATFSVAYLLRAEKINWADYIAFVGEPVGRVDAEMVMALQALPAYFEADEQEAVGHLLANSRVMGSPILDIVRTAVYAFWHIAHIDTRAEREDGYRNSVLFAVNAGWDTDTMAAIGGNIAGAWYGRAGLPEKWVAELENGYKGRDYLVLLAESLYAREDLRPKVAGWRDYLADYRHHLGFLYALFRYKPWA
ncbi:MAG TPA: ADP-ribosylglycohydrolase family protein [Anaerolineae bacterium]|nr:ADP-ribosylglycohydrolase family protein [Anaerolineae bacterium]